MEQYISWKQWRRSKFAIRRVCALTKFHSVKKLQKLNQNISLSELWIVVFHCKMLLTNRLSFLDTWRCHIYLFSHSLSVSLWLSVSSYYFLVMFFWVLSPAHTFNRKLAAHKLFHWLLYAFKLELERERVRDLGKAAVCWLVEIRHRETIPKFALILRLLAYWNFFVFRFSGCVCWLWPYTTDRLYNFSAVR